MSNVATLRILEGVDIAPHRVDEIVSELGEMAAHSLIGTALEQLALTLRTVMQAADAGDLAQVTSQMDRLSRLAWQVGLISLASVAVDVGRCAEKRDLQALAATVARLQRVGKSSLTQVWGWHQDSES